MNRKKGTEYFEYALYFLLCIFCVDTALTYFFNFRNSSLTNFNFATTYEMYFDPFSYLKCLKIMIYTHPGNYFMKN